MSEIVQFPGAEPPLEGYSQSQIDKVHAEAFRDLEGRISDCMLMAMIALQIAEPVIQGRDTKPDKAMFAVHQVVVMLTNLQNDYYSAWHGERRPE